MTVTDRLTGGAFVLSAAALRRRARAAERAACRFPLGLLPGHDARAALRPGHTDAPAWWLDRRQGDRRWRSVLAVSARAHRLGAAAVDAAITGGLLASRDRSRRLLVALAQLAPVVLMPIFYRFRPLDRPALADRLLALAERAGTPRSLACSNGS